MRVMLNFDTLKKLLLFISGIHNHFKFTPVMIAIKLLNMRAVDKLTLQLLESIIYSLIIDYRHHVTIDFQIQIQIHSEGFIYTPLHFLAKKNYNLEQFIKYFEFNTNVKHYRKVVPKSWTFDGQLGENIFPDVYQTLNNVIKDENINHALSEVITELINNANEHNDSDCLLDLDITNDYSKHNDPDGTYIGVNISTISFSNKNMPDLLLEKITSEKFSGIRYQTVANAYKNHQKFFNSKYNKNDFFMIAVFQDKISSRNSDNSGGTGLTKLIQTLEEYSDSHECYIFSSNRSMYFVHDLLNYDDNGWVGFNEERDFKNKPPSLKIFKTNPIILPGIGYNLNFVWKKG